jgi:LmbE family N-acetylglucosaminyl deacetylase
MLDSLLASRRVLWIGAHPDDELFVAPLLGELAARRAQIRFLVATRGEQGPCYRAEGCQPDLATVREEEMRCAAAVFGGDVVFAGCRDGSGGTPELVLEAWSRDAGGGAILLERFQRAVDDFAPEAILAFDGSHGATNHPDHIAAGRIVAELALRVPLWLSETRVHWGSEIHISPALPEAVAFDARERWEWLERDLACHRSQMRPGTVRAFMKVPFPERKVWVVKTMNDEP